MTRGRVTEGGSEPSGHAFEAATMPRMAIVADSQTLRILDVTDDAARILGRDRASLVDQSLDDVLADDADGAWYNEDSALADRVGMRGRGSDESPRAWYRCFRVSEHPSPVACLQLLSIPDLDSAWAEIERRTAVAVRTLTRVVRTRDRYTDIHQSGVTRLAGRIAEELGVSGVELAGVMCAAAIHDVGKLAIPTEILNYPGKLSEPAMAVMRTHAAIGYSLLSGLSEVWPLADLALQHHERADGSGYPHGLTAESLHPITLVVSVADVIDAMISQRPYRAPLAVTAVIDEIERGAGTAYTADVASAAVTMLRAA